MRRRCNSIHRGRKLAVTATLNDNQNDFNTLYHKVGGDGGAYNIACRLHPVLGFVPLRPFTKRMLTDKAGVIAYHLSGVDCVRDLVNSLKGVPVSRREISATGSDLSRYAKAVAIEIRACGKN